MKTAFIVERIVLAFTWTLLHRKLFPGSGLRRPAFSIVHILLLSICSCWIGITIGKQFLPFVCVCVSGCLNGIAIKRIRSQNIVEAIFTYLITKMLWGISLYLSFFLLIVIKPLEHDLVSGICASAIQIALCFVCTHYINASYWQIATSKYYTGIMTAFGVLFIISHGILANRETEQQREFYIYILAISALVGLILIMWAKGTYEQQKIEEAQSKHIEELVRDAHQYKEVIPAVEWKLITMRDAVAAGEHNWAMAEELGIAIEEVRAMRRGFSRESVVKLAEEQDFTSTGLLLLDGQLQMKRQEAAGEGIAFDCVVTSPAAVLVKEGVLDQFRLQQVIGDLLRNALRAIRAGGGEDRRMLLVLGETQEGYQIKLCDTGLPFPEEVLRNFGRRGLTTGGSGHGLADLCEIMARCGGSIQVTEHEAGSFTKTITLTMDGRAVLSVSSPLAGVEYVRSLVPEAVGEGSP